MEPKIWGPPAWHFLHSITFNYPDKPSYKDKSNYYDFFHNLQYILPCDVCQSNYKKHIKEYPISPYLDSKKTLVEWLIHIHNLVNKENNKKLMSSDEVIKKYKSQYLSGKHFCDDFCKNQHQEQMLQVESQKKNKFMSKILLIVLGCMLLILIIFLIQKNHFLTQKIRKLNLVV